MPSPDLERGSGAIPATNMPPLTSSSILFSPAGKRRVLIISLDFDGCIFNGKYFSKYKSLLQEGKSPLEAQKLALSEANLTLIDSLARKALGLDENNQPSDKGHYDEATFIIGSARQSWEMDFGNDIYQSAMKHGTRKGKPSGSAFDGIELFKDLVNEKISELKNKNNTVTINCTHNEYLLSDIYSNSKHGSNLDAAKKYKQRNNAGKMQQYIANLTHAKSSPNTLPQPTKNSFFDAYLQEHDNCRKAPKTVHDETKATTIYAQLNKFAKKHLNDNPNTEIDFEFYDDRSDIFDALENFHENGLLVPEKINLHLKEYSEEEIKHRKTITGKGEIDDDYENTVKRMVIAAGSKHYRDDYKTHVNVAIFNKENRRFITTVLELRNAAMKAKREQINNQENLNTPQLNFAESIINFCDNTLLAYNKKCAQAQSTTNTESPKTIDINKSLIDLIDKVKDGTVDKNTNQLKNHKNIVYNDLNDAKNNYEADLKNYSSDDQYEIRKLTSVGITLNTALSALVIGVGTALLVTMPAITIGVGITMGVCLLVTSFIHYHSAKKIGQTMQRDSVVTELENSAHCALR